MFGQIAVPVDLENRDKLDKALRLAAEESKHHNAPVTYIGITPETATEAGHNPDEYKANLRALAQEQADKHGIKTDAYAIVSTDPSAQLEKNLLNAFREIGADLVIMASHKHNWLDSLITSNAGRIARDADISVLVVR